MAVSRINPKTITNTALRELMKSRLGDAYPPVVMMRVVGCGGEPQRMREDLRYQAAINMLLHHKVRRAVEQKLGQELRSAEAGRKESRRRFPEAYVDEHS